MLPLKAKGRAAQVLSVYGVFAIAALFALILPRSILFAASKTRPVTSPVTGQAAPEFAVSGADGKLHKLADYRGRPVVLFFFCGCQWCQQCAQAWGQMQRGGALALPNPAPKDAKDPVTLVVYAGDASAVRDFARQEGLDPAQTVLLPDVEMKVTLGAYQAAPCPRVFVV